MRTPRALIAANPLQFGRGRLSPSVADRGPVWTFPDDAKLFATTFAAGFLFVSIFLA